MRQQTGTAVNRSQVSHHKAHATQHSKRHIGEQDPSGPGHRACNTTHQASTPLNRSQVAQDTAHASLQSEQVHGRTGARWRRAPHTQHNTPGEHTGEQAPSGPGHRSGNETLRASTPVNRNEVAQTPHTQHHTASAQTGEQEPSGPRHRAPNTTHRARTALTRSQVVQDTRHANRHSEQAHR